MLHVFVHGNAGVPTPGEVRAMYGGRCPFCGARLGRPGLHDITIELHSDRLRHLIRKCVEGVPRACTELLEAVERGEV